MIRSNRIRVSCAEIQSELLDKRRNSRRKPRRKTRRRERNRVRIESGNKKMSDLRAVGLEFVQTLLDCSATATEFTHWNRGEREKRKRERRERREKRRAY